MAKTSNNAFSNLPLIITDGDGKRVDNVHYVDQEEDLANSLNSIASGAASNFYYDSATKTFSNYSPVKINLNTSSGKITVQAPEYILDRDEYKESIKPILESLSSNYKTDPDFTLSDDEGNQYNINGWIDKIMKSMNDTSYQQSAALLGGAKNQLVSAGFTDATDTDAQYLIQGNSAALSDEANDYTRVVVSDFADTNYSKAMESYDADTSTVSLSDFKKWWDRSNLSDEEVRDIIWKLEGQVGAIERSADGGVNIKAISEDSKKMTAREYASKAALLQYVQTKTPQVGLLRGTAEQVGMFMGSLVYSVFGWVPDLIGAAIPGEDIFEKPGEMVEEVNELMLMVNNNLGWAQALGDFVGLFVPLSLVGKAGNAAVKTVSGKAVRTATKTAETAEKIAKATDAVKAAKTAKELTSATKKLSKAVESIEAVEVTETLGKVLKYAKSADLAETAKAALKISETVEKIATAERVAATSKKLAAKVAEFIAESVVSTIIIEPELLSKIVEGDKDGSVTNELFINLAVDSATFGATKAAGKLLSNLGETTIGGAMSANASRRMAKLEVMLTDLKDSIKTLGSMDVEDRAINLIKEGVNKGDARKVQKGLAIESNIAITNAKRELANAEKVKWIGKSSEEIKAAATKVSKAQLEVMKANNAIDLLQRNLKGIINEVIYSNKNNERAYNNLVSNFKELVKAEKAAGRKVGKKLSGAGGENLRSLSQETTNYIMGKNRMAFLERKYGGKTEFLKMVASAKGKSKALSGDVASYVDAESQVKAFLKNETLTPEVRTAADNFGTTLENTYIQFTNYFVDSGAMSKFKINELRESSLWGVEGSEYIRSQRIKGSKGHFVGGQKKLTTETQKYAAGTGDFADPMLVFSDWITKLADQVNRNNAARLLAGNHPNVLASNTLTTATKKASAAAQERLYKDVGDKLESFIEDRQYFSNIFLAQKGSDAIATSKKAVGVKSRKLASAEKKLANGTRRGATYTQEHMAVYLAELPSERVAKLVSEKYGFTSVSSAIDELVEAGNKEGDALKIVFDALPEATQDYVKSDLIQRAEIRGETVTPEDVMNYNNFKSAVKDDALLDDGIMRSILQNDESIYKTHKKELIDEVVKSQREYDVAFTSRELADEEKNLADLEAKFGTNTDKRDQGKMFSTIKDGVRNSIDDIATDIATENKNTLSGAADAVYAGKAPRGTEMYLAYRAMNKQKNMLTKKIGEAAAEEFDNIVKNSESMKKLSAGAVAKMKDTYVASTKRIFGVEFDGIMDNWNLWAKDTGNKFAEQEIFSKVNELRHEFEAYDVADNVVALGVRNGEIEYIEVDPLIATLVKTPSIRGDTGGALQNIGYVWSKLFRLGTTGLRMKSWLMQMSRDSIALYSGVGQFHTLAKGIESMTDEFGDMLLRDLRATDNMAYEAAKKEFKVAGLEGEELEGALKTYATEREINIGTGYAGTATESEAFRYRRENYEKFFDAEAGNKVTQALDNITSNEKYISIAGEKVQVNPLYWNEQREGYMRKLAYSNAFDTALKRGYSAKDARSYGMFIMNNATTNFSRMTTHLGNLQKSVPYLGSAINGTKSFYRLLSLDPVGVMGRLIGGVMMPAIAITTISLSSEENRKVYQNIPEYEKKDNICIVWDGQVIEIPIPQEMAGIFGIARTFVEMTQGANNYTFWELAVNNVLSISPIDATGFLNLDNKLLYTDDDRIWENLETGFAKMSSSFMNPALKTAIMCITGKDTYTGNAINTAYTAYDENTGETYVVDYYSGEFAKTIAKLFGQETNAYMAQALINNMLGTVGQDVIEGLYSIGSNLVNGTPSEIEGPLARTLDDAIGAFTAETYDIAQRKWRNTIAVLRNRKEEMLNSKEYQSINNTIKYAETGSEKQQKAQQQLRNLLQPLWDDTLEAVNTLNSEYPNQFTSTKFAAVVSLFNTASDNPIALISNTAIADQREEYYTGYRQAVSTMFNMGFTGTTDGSIFGYVKKSGDGFTIAYRDPVAILAYEQMSYGQGDIHSENIAATLDAAGITTSDMWNGYYAVNNNKTALKQYKAAWNAKVVKALAPYIQKYGVDTVINNSTATELLKDYIFVDYKNSTSTSKTKAYLKTIFKED